MEHFRRLSKGVDVRGLCIFEVEMIDGLVQRAPTPTLDPDRGPSAEKSRIYVKKLYYSRFLRY